MHFSKMHFAQVTGLAGEGDGWKPMLGGKETGMMLKAAGLLEQARRQSGTYDPGEGLYLASIQPRTSAVKFARPSNAAANIGPRPKQ